MKHIHSLKHHFLIATPELNGTVFERAVIYLIAHDKEGAMGLMMNKSHSVNWETVCEQLSLTHSSQTVPDVFKGGPVSEDHGYLLHQSSDGTDVLTVAPEVQVSTSAELLTDIAAGQGPQHFRFFLGYSGWDADQLDRELRDNAWLTLEAEMNLLFNTPSDALYQTALNQLGIDIHFLSLNTGHA